VQDRHILSTQPCSSVDTDQRASDLLCYMCSFSIGGKDSWIWTLVQVLFQVPHIFWILQQDADILSRPAHTVNRNEYCTDTINQSITFTCSETTLFPKKTKKRQPNARRQQFNRERREARLNKQKRHASGSGPTAAALSTAAVKATAATKPRAEAVAAKTRAAVKSQQRPPEEQHQPRQQLPRSGMIFSGSESRPGAC